MDYFTQAVVIVGRIGPQGADLLGTAFMVRKNGVFVTSRHVVGSDPKNIVILHPHISKINEYQDVVNTTFEASHAEIVEVNPIADLVLLKVDGSIPVVPELGSLDEVNVSDTVDIFGFPHCVDGRRVLTFQNAVVGAKVFLESSTIKVKHAVINSQTRPGQSGSMVFCRRINKVVGLLSGTYAPLGGVLVGGINPAELNQTSHIVSAEYIQEML